jgi:hypothetical protein
MARQAPAASRGSGLFGNESAPVVSVIAVGGVVSLS